MAARRVAIIALQAEALWSKGSARPHGGAEVQLSHIARQLSRLPGLEVILFSMADVDSVEEREGIRLCLIRRRSGRLANMRALLGALRQQDADCVLQRNRGFETLIAAYHAWRHRKKFVYSVSNDNDVKGLPTGATFDPLWRCFLWGLRGAHAIVAQSEYQNDQLRERLGRQGRVIPSIQPLLIDPNNRDATGRDRILWVGRCSRGKRPELFLELAQRHTDRKFTMVLNKGPDKEFTHSVFERAGRLANLEFFDYIPYDQVGELFRRAILFVGTSRQEGFPNTYLQAMAAATPIMSLNVDPDGVLQNHGAGYVANDSMDQLHSAMVDKLNDGEWLGQAGANGMNYIQSRHAPDRVALEWAKLFDELCAQ